MLVVNDAWYPGWEAYLDGTAAAISEVNGGVRGVEVPAGVHRVSMAFHQPGLAPGLALAVLCVLGAFVVARFARSKQVTRAPSVR